MNNEEEILKKCDLLFVTMANVHIDGKPMADLLKLYEQTKEELDKLKEIEEENYFQRKQLNDAFNRDWIHKDKIREVKQECNKSIC